MPQPAAPELARTERLLSELIRAPSGVAQAIERDREHSGSLAAQLAGAVNGDAERPAVLRLDVYANAYFFRILDCLREDYAALAQALGDTAFHNLVVGYLLAFPPRHPSIRYCGDRVAEFLRDQPGAAATRERFPWSAALAELEWALQGAFDAAEAEPLRAEDVAGTPAEQWGALALRADPAVHWLDLDWPVAAMRRAFERDAPLPIADLRAARERILVWRRAEQVAYRVLEPDEAAALALVVSPAGTTFGDVCECAAQFAGADAAPGRAAGWLARWLQDTCIRRA